MRRPRAPATMVHSLSCTDLDWERVRERADAAGLSMSRYLVGRGLTVELPRDGDGKVRPPPRLVLEESEQRAMHDRIARIAKAGPTHRCAGALAPGKTAPASGPGLCLLPSSRQPLVDPLPQYPRGPEHHHPARRNRRRLAGPGVPTQARFLVAPQEIAEPRDPHRFPRYQLFADRLDHRVDQPADSRRDNPTS